MQKTSDGKQKIIERIDCSGAGDVDMSREVTPNKDGIIEGMISLYNKVYANYFSKIFVHCFFSPFRFMIPITFTGLTGRQLTIPEGWTNPTGKYRIGVKRAMELYPRSLRDRMIKERQEKQWDPYHKKAMAEASRKINELESSQSKSGEGNLGLQ